MRIVPLVAFLLAAIPCSASAQTAVNCDAPRILTQPRPLAQTLAVGTRAEFSVLAAGRALSYRWFHAPFGPTGSFAEIPGATASTLVLDPLAFEDTGRYLCVVSNSCGSVRSRQVRLTVVASVPPVSIDFVPVFTAVDLTPDGSVALLTDLSTFNGDVWLYDTATKNLQLATQVGSPLRDFVTGISATERISALHDDPVQAGLWTAAGGWLDLGSPFPMGCFMDIGGAWDVSADGSVAVGLLWNGCAPVAFRWTDASGVGAFTLLEVLGAPYPGSTTPPANRATVVSDDARFAAGFAQTEIVDRWPAIWDASGAGFLLDSEGLFPDDAPGEVLSISADGSVVAGIWNQDGFVWSAATGLVDIGRLPKFLPFEPTFPNAIAAGGELVFGGSGDPFFGIPAAFVWTKARGMRSLQETAAAGGVVFPPGTILTNVLAASADGGIVLGQAFDASFATVSFVLRLPVSAYGL